MLHGLQAEVDGAGMDAGVTREWRVGARSAGRLGAVRDDREPTPLLLLSQATDADSHLLGFGFYRKLGSSEADLMTRFLFSGYVQRSGHRACHHDHRHVDRRGVRWACRVLLRQRPFHILSPQHTLCYSYGGLLSRITMADCIETRR